MELEASGFGELFDDGLPLVMGVAGNFGDRKTAAGLEGAIALIQGGGAMV